MPIDAVYTWVDGSDPIWQARRTQYASQCDPPDVLQDGLAANRFNDRQELRYSLRSLAVFAPWIRRIFIVTDQQRPSWLLVSERVVIVDHARIFEDRRHAPSFSSRAIEGQLDRIPDLAERFLFFNDDMMLSGPVAPSDFFTADGRPRVSFKRGRRLHRLVAGEYVESARGVPHPNDNSFQLAWKNNNRLLDAELGPERRFQLAHQVLPLTKGAMARARERFREPWGAVSACRFRSRRDVHPLALTIYLALATNRAISDGPLRGKMVQFTNNLLRNEIVLHTIQRRTQALCFNDDTSVSPDSLLDRLITWRLRRELARRFPRTAPWEATGDAPRVG